MDGIVPRKEASMWGDIRYCVNHTCAKPTCVSERVAGRFCLEHLSRKQRDRFMGR